MSNERLRRAIEAARKTIDDVAEEAGVDPKTVQRWLKGRTPYQRHRWAIAKLLDEDESYLWPPEGAAIASGDASTHELIAAYAHRAAVPPRSWWKLLSAAEGRIDLLGYAMLHLPEQHPELMSLLRDKGASGCQVRVALADPESEQARIRDEEEDLDGGLLARIRTSTKYFSELAGCDGVELRAHATPMYNSVFRFGDQMYVTPHLYGVPGAKAPLLHLRRRGPDGMFEKFATHFDAIWSTATPLLLEPA